MSRQYGVVAARAGHRCEYCHAPESLFNIRFEVEHVFPSSLGGTDEVGNLALACRACNLRKSNLTHFADPASQEVVQIFNPRIDQWDEHFEIDTLSIAGTTPIGRATVACLELNSDSQRSAREHWKRLGHFP